MVWVGFLALVACGTDGEGSDTTDTSPPTSSEVSTVPALGHCVYVNAFSQDEECKNYTGAGLSLIHI